MCCTSVCMQLFYFGAFIGAVVERHSVRSTRPIHCNPEQVADWHMCSGQLSLLPLVGWDKSSSLPVVPWWRLSLLTVVVVCILAALWVLLSITFNLMTLTALFQGSDVSTKIGRTSAGIRNSGRMPFLPPPVTHLGTSGNLTKIRWVQVSHLNHWTCPLLPVVDWLMHINCHFQDCRTLLLILIALQKVSGPLPWYNVGLASWHAGFCCGIYKYLFRSINFACHSNCCT